MNDKVQEELNDNEKDFLRLIYLTLKNGNEIMNAKVVKLSGKSAATARRYFAKLVDVGVLKATGFNRSRKYFLLLDN
ncbi:MAG: hypothetical protein QM571_01855 [Micrococcaceae bacterium]